MGKNIEPLESLVEFYSKEVIKRIKAAEQGVRITYDEMVWIRENRILNISGIFMDEDRLQAREKVFLGLCYEKLTAMNEEQRDCVKQTVQDPLLNGIFEWLKDRGRIEQVSRESFLNGFDTKQVGQRRLDNYLNKLVFLDIIINNPDVILKLEEGSSYAPHIILRKRKPTIKEVLIDIASVISDIPSELLIDKISEISRYIQRRESQGTRGILLGKKYKIPNLSNFSWKEGFDERMSEEELDKLYNSFSIKRECLIQK